jgi:hypothetical protein
MDRQDVHAAIVALGDDGDTARKLAASADEIAASIVSLSTLTADLALDYLERLARPIPSLTAEAGVQLVAHAYAARVAVERDPTSFGVRDLPVVGNLPPFKHGRPPQGLLVRVVKATKRGFPETRAVAGPVWEGYTVLLTERMHRSVADDEDLIASEVVDGLARFGWVLRQVDVNYGLDPELAT